MPKFTYSASKGIEQTSGSGFFVNDAPIVENQQTVVTAALASADNAINAYGATSITLTNGVSNATATLADGSYIGQKKYFVVATDGAGGATFRITPATFSDGTRFDLDTAAQSLSLVWLGSTTGWKVLLNVGSVSIA
jgi:hypothetical protein